jgi:hypothetical protein
MAPSWQQALGLVTCALLCGASCGRVQDRLDSSASDDSTPDADTGGQQGQSPFTPDPSLSRGYQLRGECFAKTSKGGDFALIDDLEHPEDPYYLQVDGRHGGWFVGVDHTVGATIAPAVGKAWPTAGSGANGQYGFATTADGAATWGAVFGLNLNEVDELGCMYDASAYVGVEFWIQATNDVTQSLDFGAEMIDVLPVSAGGNCLESCDDVHSVKIEVTPTWTLKRVLWDQLKQNAGWAHDSKFAFNPARLSKLRWYANEKAGGFSVAVDDVAFLVPEDLSGVGGEGGTAAP